MLQLSFSRFRFRSALRAIATAAALVAPGSSLAVAQEPSIQLNASFEGTGLTNALVALDYLLSNLGPHHTGHMLAQGPAVPFDGNCPPAGTIVEDATHTLNYYIDAEADAETGESRVAFDAEFCRIVSTNPCEIQCFELSMRWFNLDFAIVHATFTTPPGPPSPPPPPSPPDPPSSGFSVQSIEHGNGCIEVQLVLYGGWVYTGAEFHERFPGLVADVFAFLQARFGPNYPLNADCFTWTQP